MAVLYKSTKLQARFEGWGIQAQIRNLAAHSSFKYLIIFNSYSKKSETKVYVVRCPSYKQNLCCFILNFMRAIFIVDQA